MGLSDIQSRLAQSREELKRNAEAQQQEMDKQKEQSSRPCRHAVCGQLTSYVVPGRLAKDLQAQLAAVSEGAKEKSKADDEPARHTGGPERQRGRGREG